MGKWPYSTLPPPPALCILCPVNTQQHVCAPYIYLYIYKF